ncbi:MAG: enolase C-terminal domain-like protein, partial [Bacteroidia bacterium]
MAAIDMAIFDLAGKLLNTPCHKMLHIENKSTPLLSYTITYEKDKKILLEKINDAKDFKQLKLKLGTADDKDFIDFVLKNSDKPFFADANQGWKTLQEAVYMTEYLKERNCLFIEQPFSKDAYDLSCQLKQKKILPVFADESIANFSDLEKYYSYFDGVNIKLKKCGGIKNAIKMISFARKKNIKTLM